MKKGKLLNKSIKIITSCFCIFLVLYLLESSVYADDSYLIEFLNEDGSLICSNTYAYGESIYIPDDPFKEADETYEYRFEGWGDAVHPICTKNKTYKAEFSKEYIYYNVKIVDYDGNCLDSYYTRYVGYYGDSLEYFSQNLKQYFKNDAFMSEDMKVGNPYSSKIWADFCRAVMVHDFPYDQSEKYECIGFESCTDGTFYKIDDFASMTLTRDEDFRITFAKKEGYNPLECNINYKYVSDFDIDDPTRALSYDEVDESKTILDLYYKEGEPLFKPIGDIPFPETVTSSSGQTYYLSQRKRLFYYDELNTYESDIVTEYHMLMDTYVEAGKYYILPVYEEYPTGTRMSSMDLQWDRYDADGNCIGYSRSNAFVGFPFDVPSSPGYTTYDNGHETRTFTGKYRVVSGSNRTLGYVNAGEMIRIPQEWVDYNGGFAFLVDDYTAVTNMYDVNFVDYDGAYFKRYHIRNYAKMYIPEDPVRDDDEDYTYEFEGWRNEETGEIVDSISDRCKGAVTYVASYKATKVIKSTFSVTVPAKVSLVTKNGILVGEGIVTTIINTNADNFYVDVIPDSSLELSGIDGTLTVGISQEKTRFYGEENNHTADEVKTILKSDGLPVSAGKYTGNYSYTIASGYE